MTNMGIFMPCLRAAERAGKRADPVATWILAPRSKSVRPKEIVLQKICTISLVRRARKNSALPVGVALTV